MELECPSASGAPYRLGRRLKAGTTGDVFETVHPLLPGPCALKILRPELTARPESLEAFRADLEAVSALRHPNIVHVIEVGARGDGTTFVAMELLEGRLLAERLAGRRIIPLAEVIEIVRTTAAALQAAHGRGVVHGEINPGNVFLVRTEGYEHGVVKLLNFGIARLRSADAPASLPVQAARYLSPEQAAGRTDNIDGRADQFALAALAYRMLAGEDAFMGDSALSMIYQLVHGQPAFTPPPELSSEVEMVIRRGLAKNKSDRFETVLAFARAFESAALALSGRVTPRVLPAPPSHPPPPNPAPAPRAGGPSTLRGFAAGGGIIAGQAHANPTEAPPAPRDDPDPLLTDPFFVPDPPERPRPRVRRRPRRLPLRVSRPRGTLLLFIFGVFVAVGLGALALGWQPPPLP